MTKRNRLIAGALLAIAFTPLATAAQEHSLSISVKNHQFQPAQISAPANVPIVLTVKNLDPTPMEFESVSLRVEKVITGGGTGTVRLRPLSAGSYKFFDDFHQQTNGVLVVR